MKLGCREARSLYWTELAKAGSVGLPEGPGSDHVGACRSCQDDINQRIAALGRHKHGSWKCQRPTASKPIDRRFGKPEAE